MPTGKGSSTGVGKWTDTAKSKVYDQKPEKIVGVLDGTSNTTLVGERVTTTHPTRATFWANSYNLYSNSGASQYSQSLLNDYDACGGDAQNYCKYGWGSTHAGGGINFVFADGSVKAIPTSITMSVFQNLATMAAGDDIFAYTAP